MKSTYSFIERTRVTKLKTTGSAWTGFRLYALWYALAVWAVISAVRDALPGSWLRFLPDAATGSPDIWNYAANTGIALIATAVTVRAHVRHTRDGMFRLRSEFFSLVAERARAQERVTWLNRDAHLAFMPYVSGRFLLRRAELCLVDEDLVCDIDAVASAGGGRVALTATFYSVVRLYARVLRQVKGWVTLATAADLEAVKQPRDRLRRAPGLLRELARGRMFATAEELADVIAQFRAAEPLGPPEEPA